MEWVEVMDTNQSGVIDYEEFYKFFSNLDELPLNDNQIASMFREFDTSNDQHISVEEFATAMVNACEIYNNEGEIQDDNIYSKLDSLRWMYVMMRQKKEISENELKLQRFNI